MKKKTHEVARLSRELIAKRYRQKKGVFVLYLVLNLLVLASIVSAAIQARWESIFIGFLATISIRTKIILPPSSAGRGKRLNTPRFIVISVKIYKSE